MTTTKTVNVPFTVTLQTGAYSTTAYAFDLPNIICTYGSPLTALRKMRKVVTEEVLRLVVESDRVYQHRHLIVCQDGTILLVEYKLGNWGYTSLRVGEHTCGSWGSSTFAEALARAQNHATSGYGGITWEGRL